MEPLVTQPIHVEVRDEPSKLAALARKVPEAVRRRPVLIAAGQAALAFVPTPLLLLAFSLPTVAGAWTAISAFIGLIFYSIEQEVPTASLGPARITIDERGVTIEREQKLEQWRGAALRDLQVLPDALVLLSHRDGWLVIPRASFSPDTCERFIAAVRAHLAADNKAPEWPKRSPLVFGVIAFLLAVAAGLGAAAWNASVGQRMVCAPLAGICVMFATADMSSSSQRLMGRRPGRPAPPRPGSTTESYLAAVRIEELRPSASLVLGVYALAATLLYVTLVTRVIGTSIFVVLALLTMTFAIFESTNVFEMWWPWRPVRSWRQIELGSHGVTRRHAGVSVTVPWSKLAEPVVRDDLLLFDWADKTKFESVTKSNFAQPEDWDAFVAVARARGAR